MGHSEMEHYILIIAIISIPVMLAAIITIIVFSCTKSQREYNRIKNISETEGTIIDIEFVCSSHSFESSYKYYVVSYSFTDSFGKMYNKSFKHHRSDDFKEGDKIIVYYDIDNPDKCVTDYKLKADKNCWWQALIIAAIIIIVPIVISFAIL